MGIMISGQVKLGLGILGLVVLLGAGVLTVSIASQPRIDTASGGEFVADSKAIFNGQAVSSLAPLPEPESVVLGEATGDEKWIEVDLTYQRLRAYEGDRVVYEFPISSGKWFPTPVGEYRIWSKFKYIKMEGGVKGTGTYYYLPNVPYVMFFYQGFGIHGTYWHNNFGHPMSHGCVNMAIPDAEKLFYWADPPLDAEGKSKMASNDVKGTRVIVRGKAPRD